MAKRKYELAGQRFHRLTVVEYIGDAKWLCSCDCGGSATPTGFSLVSGKATSCGCRHREISSKVNTVHGLIGRKAEYEAWSGAKKRCYNEACKSYPRYGGRGIVMDTRWIDDFAAFYADMGPKPSPQHSLDRIDNDGPYAPDNCRWATRVRQSRNRRSNVLVSYQGREMALSDACDLAGVPFNRVQARLKYLGWDFDRAISQPSRLDEPKSKAKIAYRPFPDSREQSSKIVARPEHFRR